MGRSLLRAIAAVALTLCYESALAFGWDDLWKRSDQQVNELIKQQAFEQAAELAQTAEQSALVQYRAGDFGASADSYEKSEQHYNRGTALTRAGDYEGAVEAFDQLLSDDKDYEDALHNRKIAQKLAELQQQKQQNQEGEGEGEGQQNNQKPSGDESSDSQGQSNDPTQGEEQKSGDDSSEPSQGDGSDSKQSPDEETKDGQPGQSPEEPQPSASESEANEKPSGHDEKQQAMDQWLQRVPDDPAGLLRARIIREHQRSYQNSQDQEQAW